MNGVEARDYIIDRQESYYEQSGEFPRVMLLPVRLAWDLAKCRRSELGELSSLLLRHGVRVLERIQFRGMAVRLIRRPDAQLAFA